jgi:hypothetical protein
LYALSEKSAAWAKLHSGTFHELLIVVEVLWPQPVFQVG